MRVHGSVTHRLDVPPGVVEGLMKEKYPMLVEGDPTYREKALRVVEEQIAEDPEMMQYAQPDPDVEVDA